MSRSPGPAPPTHARPPAKQGRLLPLARFPRLPTPTFPRILPRNRCHPAGPATVVPGHRAEDIEPRTSTQTSHRRRSTAMWHDMFVTQIPIAEKILRTVLVYATILVLLRLAGKRDLATL